MKSYLSFITSGIVNQFHKIILGIIFNIAYYEVTTNQKVVCLYNGLKKTWPESIPKCNIRAEYWI